MSYLQLLPIDELKIDQAFVREIGTVAEATGRAPKLVQSLVALGHSLGLAVVAEGVETGAQLEFLARVGCDRVQGYGDRAADAGRGVHAAPRRFACRRSALQLNSTT